MIKLSKARFERYMPVAAESQEASMFDALKGFFEESHNSLKRNLLGSALAQKIDAKGQSDESYQMVEGYVYNSAMVRAIRQLDVVLTPNGFGIVNTGQVSPASKERVEALLKQCVAASQDYYAQLLEHVDEFMFDDWCSTKQHDVHTITFIYRLDQFREVTKDDQTWADFLLHRPKMLGAEVTLQRVISREYSEALHDRMRGHELTQADVKVLRLVRRLIGMEVMDADRHVLEQAKIDLVDYLYEHADSLPEYKASEQYRLKKSPKVYENRKEDGGYWL